MEGFKHFKVWYNIKNARAARNDPNVAYPSAKTVYQAVKGLGCTLCSFNSLSLDDFISSGSVAARRCLKHLSLAPYYMAQMKQSMQKWDRYNDQGPNLGTIDTCRQLIGIVGTNLYHSMVDVQSVVGQTVDLCHRYDFLVCLWNGLNFFELFKLYFHLGLITTLHVHMTYV